MDPNAPPRPKLGTEGQIYVTLRAAEEWLAANDFGGVEEARRDLTELLVDAHRVDSKPDQVRYRSRAEGLDLQAHVVPEGKLLVVASVQVREVTRGSRASRDGQQVRRLERRAEERPLTPAEQDALEKRKPLVESMPRRPRRIVR